MNILVKINDFYDRFKILVYVKVIVNERKLCEETQLNFLEKIEWEVTKLTRH